MPKSTKKPTNVKRTLHYFWQANKKYKLYTIGSVLLTVIVILERSVISPLALAQVVDLATQGLSQEALLAAIWPATTILLASEVTRNFIFGPLRLWCIWSMEIDTIRDLDGLAFAVVDAQSMQFHSNRFSGSLVSQVNRFVSAYERFADELLWNVLPVALDMIFIIIVMLPRVPLFVLGLVILSILFMTAAVVWFKKLAPLNEHLAEVDNKKTGQLADSITNIMSVKSYAQEKHEIRRYATFRETYRKAAHRLLIAETKRNYFFDSVNVGVSMLAIAVLIFGHAWFGISAATLILIINYSQHITGDLWSVHSVFKTFNRIFGDAHELTEILDLPDDVVDEPNAKELTVKQGAVDFSHVTFHHADAKETIFSDFSLELQPGERIGLVGISGSGKTTLTKLLLRFADVQDGAILIDGQNIRQVTQASLRQNIAYVPQETSLFHRSIAENIAYAKPDASMDEIQRAAKLANAHEFIKEFPDGYNTLVGERGVKLSGGQRQRIAIARAILKDAPILVLDEATSALDSESEALIQDALKVLMKGRTSIVIAHRLSTVASLDRIVVLSDGKIVEQGTHQQLLKANGAYHKLWSRQSGAFLDS